MGWAVWYTKGLVSLSRSWLPRYSINIWGQEAVGLSSPQGVNLPPCGVWEGRLRVDEDGGGGGGTHKL